MEYSKDNTMTRKEYLKSKKKNKFDFSKLKYILLLIVVILLGVYVFKQLKIYNNVTQIANKVVEESKLARTMTMYYVSDSYTKEGSPIVMLYKSSDESRTTVVGTEKFTKISVTDEEIYGLVDNTLYSVNFTNYVKEKVVDGLDKKIQEYVVKENIIYIRATDGIYKYDTESKEIKQLIKGKSYQMVVDDSGIYIIASGKTNKSVIKYNLNGVTKTQLSGTYIASCMRVLGDDIFFVNSKDSKLYCVSKNGGEIKKIVDAKVKATVLKYNNHIYYINASDSNTLYSLNLKTGEHQRIVKKNITSMQIDNNIIYYKVSNDLGIYKFDLNTGKTSKITSIRATEYLCIN